MYPCPRGGYCPSIPDGETHVSCPAGYYNDLLYGQSIADCKLCPAGRQCAAGAADRGVICPKTHYCPRGTAPGLFPCPKGTYGGNEEGKKDVSQCLVCPAGHVCGEGTDVPAAVPPGYYQPNSGIGDTEASYLCPPKFYCPNSAMTNYKGFHCAAGHYCPAGSTSAEQEKCPYGTYSDATDLHDRRDCQICPAGKMCTWGTSSTNSLMLPCPNDFFCLEGTKYDSTLAALLTANQANWEFALTARDQPPMPCPAGTHAPYANSKTLEDCAVCDAGNYCNKGRNPCPAGHYCP